MKDKEKLFTHELEVFRTEIESAIQFFYADRAMNGVLAKDKYTLAIVNRTPLFWVTTAGALHSAFFITLGRIFDQDSNHNVDKTLRTAQAHLAIFSKEALERRKREGSANAAEWRTKNRVSALFKILTEKHRGFRLKIFYEINNQNS